ncbi:MAG: Txe/YoeB family addiction module toxin [Desulfitobacteriaceae bacterium]
MNKLFTQIARVKYLHWQTENKLILKRINELIKDIERSVNSRMGKPEALKHELASFWSRRITDEHRLSYSIEGKNINIISCRGHY